MSGYTAPQRTFLLRFVDPAFEGFECEVEGLSVAEYEDLAEAPTLDPAFELFAQRIKAWNLRDPVTGEPVPANLDGLRAQPRDWARHVVREWVDAASGLTAPFERSLTAGLRPRSSAEPPPGMDPVPLSPEEPPQRSAS